MGKRTSDRVAGRPGRSDRGSLVRSAVASLRAYLSLLAAVTVGGCSSTFFFLPDAPPSVEPSPADYQAWVAKDLGNLKDRSSMGPFEISPLRSTRLAQPGDWIACVRTTIQERPTYFAVFIREGRVVERRQAVVIDQCAQEEFQPLPGMAASKTLVNHQGPNSPGGASAQNPKFEHPCRESDCELSAQKAH